MGVTGGASNGCVVGKRALKARSSIRFSGTDFGTGVDDRGLDPIRWIGAGPRKPAPSPKYWRVEGVRVREILQNSDPRGWVKRRADEPLRRAFSSASGSDTQRGPGALGGPESAPSRRSTIGFLTNWRGVPFSDSLKNNSPCPPPISGETIRLLSSGASLVGCGAGRVFGRRTLDMKAPEAVEKESHAKDTIQIAVADSVQLAL